MTKLRVLLADDHAVVREGLKALINAQMDMEVIGEAADGRSAWEQARECGPDVVVMDVSMPHMNGIQATAQIRAACPDVRVLALSVHEDGIYQRRLQEAGAAGYVLKRGAVHELIRAIRVVAEGGTYLGATHAKEAGREEGKHAAGEALSAREAEVVRLIAEGHPNKEVAVRLAVSVKSVETYKARSLEKLGLESRADLVRYALARGWLRDV